MKLYGWKDIDEWIFGKTIDLPNTKSVDSEDIPPAAMVLGQAWLGKPSSGKTAALARTQVDHLIAHPEESLVSFDGSQSFTDTFLNIVLSKPKPIRDAFLKRIIYDEIGHPD